LSIQFWVALDGDNRITINKALRGAEYTCLECNGKMIPKKGEIRTHHFAHKGEFTCSGEGQKHLYVKELIYEMLLMNQDSLYLKSASIEMEKKLLGLIPDVCIRWTKGHLRGEYLAIEVWNHGESSEKKKETFGKNMVEFNIKDWGEKELGNPYFIFNEIYPFIFQKIHKMRNASMFREKNNLELNIKQAKANLKDLQDSAKELHKYIEINSQKSSMMWLVDNIGKGQKITLSQKNKNKNRYNLDEIWSWDDYEGM